jgi:hypothetical protein
MSRVAHRTLSILAQALDCIMAQIQKQSVIIGHEGAIVLSGLGFNSRSGDSYARSQVLR